MWRGSYGDVANFCRTVLHVVKGIMEGEEAEQMRNRARRLAKMAKEAMEEGGTSYSNLNSLIEQL